MALWKDYVTRKLFFENHPALAQSGCLNARQTRTPCTVCQTVCPQGVFDRPDPDWDRCDGCGICAAACPARCIAPSALTAGKVLELCRRVRGDVTLACERHDGSADLKLPCLAALPWELLAFFALGGQVTLLRGDCDGCPHEGQMDCLERALTQAGETLGDSPAAQNLTQPACAAQPPQRGFNRREAFSLLFSKSQATLASLLPEEKELVPDGTLWRQLFVHRLRKTEGAATHWVVPAFTEGCNACGLCVKLCPAQALHRVQGEDDPARWHMALIPWRCTGCALCAGGCPTAGLTDPTPTALDDPARPLLHTVSRPPCPRCGEPAEEAGQPCPRCQGELAAPIVW